MRKEKQNINPALLPGRLKVAVFTAVIGVAVLGALMGFQMALVRCLVVAQLTIINCTVTFVLLVIALGLGVVGRFDHLLLLDVHHDVGLVVGQGGQGGVGAVVKAHEHADGGTVGEARGHVVGIVSFRHLANQSIGGAGSNDAYTTFLRKDLQRAALRMTFAPACSRAVSLPFSKQ